MLSRVSFVFYSLILTRTITKIYLTKIQKQNLPNLLADISVTVWVTRKVYIAGFRAQNSLLFLSKTFFSTTNTLRDTNRNSCNSSQHCKAVLPDEKLFCLYLGKYQSHRKKFYIKTVENFMIYIFSNKYFLCNALYARYLQKVCF